MGGPERPEERGSRGRGRGETGARPAAQEIGMMARRALGEQRHRAARGGGGSDAHRQSNERTSVDGDGEWDGREGEYDRVSAGGGPSADVGTSDDESSRMGAVRGGSR